jgi:hypothetical protein
MRFTDEDYAELLGLYLGDGFISRGARTFRLRITLDARYAQIIEDGQALLQRCFPYNSVDIARIGTTGNCVNLSTYSCHLPCLFPQHGRGLKHRRKIELEAWQEKLLARAPWSFIRGCIRSDGCAFINRTDVHRDKPYEYLSYCFSNMSKDIVDLFTTACDVVDIQDYRATSDRRGRWNVRINRRASVAMLEHVGLKT